MIDKILICSLRMNHASTQRLFNCTKAERPFLVLITSFSSGKATNLVLTGLDFINMLQRIVGMNQNQQKLLVLNFCKLIHLESTKLLTKD